VSREARTVDESRDAPRRFHMVPDSGSQCACVPTGCSRATKRNRQCTSCGPERRSSLPPRDRTLRYDRIRCISNVWGRASQGDRGCQRCARTKSPRDSHAAPMGSELADRTVGWNSLNSQCGFEPENNELPILARQTVSRINTSNGGSPLSTSLELFSAIRRQKDANCCSKYKRLLQDRTHRQRAGRNRPAPE
jgi:hypothetical protein